MTFNVLDITAYLLPEYERRTRERKLDIAAKIGVSGACYYRMRKGEGNIGSDATAGALEMIYGKYPELVIEAVFKSFFEEDPNLFCNTIVELLSLERLMQMPEQKKRDGEKYELALSSYRRIYG